MKNRSFVVFFLTLLFLATSVGAAQVKVGYVDLQKALNTSQAGKDAKAKIAKKAKEYEVGFVQKRKEIKDLGQNLKNQTALLSPEAKKEKEREYQQKVTDFQRATKDAQTNLKQQDTDFTREIVRELVKIVEKIGKKEAFTIILEKGEGSIVYADKQVDLTDKLIKEYDKVYQSGK
jgi:outer membrane protein